MRIPLLALFAPLALVLVACEPSRLPPDLDELVARYGEARGGFLDRCVTPHSIHGPFARDAEPTLASVAPPPESRAQIEAELRQRFDDDTRAFDRAAFERCVTALDVAPSCPADPLALFVRAGCGSMFVGARVEGEGCADDFSCTPGLFCDSVFGECGLCAPDLGAPPLNLLCAEDPACGTERAPAVEGAACTSNCGNGPYPSLACIDGACVARAVVDVGEACDVTQDVPWTIRSIAHCRDSDFGSTLCLDAVCVAVVREVEDVDDPIGEAGVFVPGAAVVTDAVVGAGGFGEPLECAP